MADLEIDFTSGAIAHRLRFGGGRGQDLPKAVGLKNGAMPHVVDATAGLGRDAFLLASLGARVTLIERSARVHALLATALEKAKASNVAEIVARMDLLFGDAKDLLPGLLPDVVLVDPMHPPRGNSALVKQDMRQLRAVVGEDPDALELMKVALESARKRVVLKWPRKAKGLAGLPAPSHTISGKSTRYDVWMLANALV
ncbi:MAG: class I SAM-dependent methyltransferase [Rhodobacteraceae bacterium]|nr:class I SAM-dependent methyltransferase [Paracoccaceae bacterium]